MTGVRRRPLAEKGVHTYENQPSICKVFMKSNHCSKLYEAVFRTERFMVNA